MLGSLQMALLGRLGHRPFMFCFQISFDAALTTFADAAVSKLT